MKRYFLALCLLFGCTKQNSTTKTPLVVTSVSPYNTFVERIVGNTMQVRTLVPLGHNSHHFEPTAKQLASLAQAKLFIGIGDSYEKKIIESVKTHTPYMAVLNLSKDPREDHHYWMSPKKVIEQLIPITEALIRIMPKNKKLYVENVKELVEELTSLQDTIAHKLAPYKGQAIVTSHPALAYYCEDFHLMQLSLEHHGKAPLPRQVAELVQKAKEEKARCVFTQLGFDNRGAILVAKHLNLPTYSLDPQNPEYFENLKKITLEIASE
jgi:zinc transport system substrate-binding protein